MVERVRLLVVMGSGETSPTMVTVHKELAARLGGSRIDARLVDTPYGFQENADEISAKAVRYFAHSVGLEVRPLPGMRTPLRGGPDTDRGLAELRAADWVFAGPGSPTYALDQWRGSAVGATLTSLLYDRGTVAVFASAAACTIGAYALPVYEIYKVGAAPYWRDGIDLFGAAGLPVALIPHYDNAEGGTHDTRYCYLGERRLRGLEADLPAGAAVLGVDEHTALIVDLAGQTVVVHGRGGVTVRRSGRSRIFPAGSELALDELRALVVDTRPIGSSAAAVAPEPDPGTAETLAAADATGTLWDAVRSCERAFDVAAQAYDGPTMAAAVLDLDAAITAWSGDTLQSDEADRARQVLRSLVVRLGQAAGTGGDPRDALAPIVDPLVALRQRLRADGAFTLADALRDALAAVVEVRDTPTGPYWRLVDSAAGSRSSGGTGRSRPSG